MAEKRFIVWGLEGSTSDDDELWVVENVGEHTCAGGTPEVGGAHEAGCGYVPVTQLRQTAAVETAKILNQLYEIDQLHHVNPCPLTGCTCGGICAADGDTWPCATHLIIHPPKTETETTT